MDRPLIRDSHLNRFIIGALATGLTLFLGWSISVLMDIDHRTAVLEVRANNGREWMSELESDIEDCAKAMHERIDAVYGVLFDGRVQPRTGLPDACRDRGVNRGEGAHPED